MMTEPNSKKKGVEWWNGRTESYFSDPAVEEDLKKLKTELAFLVKDGRMN